MATRISNLETTTVFIEQMYRQRVDLERSRQQISSGLRLEMPSDDPTRTSTVSQLQNTVLRLERHKERIAFSTNVLSQQDALLQAAGDIMVRAKEIASLAANETLAPELRAAMADEVFGLRDTLVGLANTKVDGVYIYGGADDDDPPFDALTYTVPADPTLSEATRYVFDGEAGTEIQRRVKVGDSEEVQITTSGETVFAESIGALERLGRCLKGYDTTLDGTTGLPDGGGNAYNFPADYRSQTNSLARLIDASEAGRVNIEQERSSVGGRMNRLEQISQTIETVKAQAQESRSLIQDIDIFEAASTMANLQIGLEALLASGAQINNLSLLNFL